MRTDDCLSNDVTLVPRWGLEQVQILPNRKLTDGNMCMFPSVFSVRDDLHLFQTPSGDKTDTIGEEIVRSHHRSRSRGWGGSGSITTVCSINSIDGALH